jgi:hypothetical protein
MESANDRPAPEGPAGAKYEVKLFRQLAAQLWEHSFQIDIDKRPVHGQARRGL